MTHPDAQRAFEEMMPEPFGHVPFPGEFYKSEELDAEVKADPMVPAVYSRDQLRTAMQAVWDAATERAAKVCEKSEPFGYILHWPRIGGGVELLFDKSRVAGDAIGCKVTPVYEAPPAVLVTDDTWPKYIAGIIETYIKQNRTDEDREAGIAKIIERRMYSMASPRGAK